MAKQIPLSRGQFATVDDADFSFLMQWKWHIKETTTKCYAVRTAYRDGVRQEILMHRALMDADRRQFARIDHRDGDGLNNQRHNLRPATHVQNMHNRQKTQGSYSSPYKGVFRVTAWALKKPWRAMIVIDNRHLHLGYFATEIEAARAYNQAAEQYLGAFARPNQEPGGV